MKKIIKLIIACLVTAPFRALAADPAYLTSSFTVIKSVMASLVVAMIGLAVVWFTWNVIKYAMSADEKGKELKKITQNYHLIAIRSFLKYLAKRDIKTLSAEKIEIGKNPSHEIEFLDGEEVERLLQAAGSDTLKALRDRSILELLFSAGLRVSELININRDQINLERQEFSVRGKGDKLRLVFISDTAKNYLEKYLNKRVDLDNAVFIRFSKKKKTEDQETKRLTPRSI
ncbi:MAG: tyrosine-type recombinase/integrase, partial [bacterium]